MPSGRLASAREHTIAHINRGTAARYGIKRNATGRVLVGSLTRAVAKGDTTVTVTLARKAR
jgi:hypothetical protein